MKYFVESVKPMVLKKGTDDFSLPGRQQPEAEAIFPSMVQNTEIELWQQDRQPEPDERHLVIGVATWSRPDMELLDELTSAVPVLKRSGLRVEIFNAAGFHNRTDFDERIPGLGTVYHTPVA